MLCFYSLEICSTLIQLSCPHYDLLRKDAVKVTTISLKKKKMAAATEQQQKK